MYTFFNTTSTAPHCVPASFLRRDNLRIVFVSALQMCLKFKIVVFLLLLYNGQNADTRFSFKGDDILLHICV